MVEANAKEYLLEHNKVAAWLCGDKEGRGCGLNGELTDLGCHSCMYKVGQMGRNTIRDDAKIYYNPNLPSSDFIEKE